MKTYYLDLLGWRVKSNISVESPKHHSDTANVSSLSRPWKVAHLLSKPHGNHADLRSRYSQSWEIEEKTCGHRFETHLLIPFVIIFDAEHHGTQGVLDSPAAAQLNPGTQSMMIKRWNPMKKMMDETWRYMTMARDDCLWLLWWTMMDNEGQWLMRMTVMVHDDGRQIDGGKWWMMVGDDGWWWIMVMYRDDGSWWLIVMMQIMRMDDDG